MIIGNLETISVTPNIFLGLYLNIFLLVQIEYTELEAFNGDSSSVLVETDSFAISKLQPGRNYSIAIKSVSNGMESIEKRFYQATSKTLDKIICYLVR